jgi:hypothetical protein
VVLFFEGAEQLILGAAELVEQVGDVLDLCRVHLLVESAQALSVLLATRIRRRLLLLLRRLGRSESLRLIRRDAAGRSLLLLLLLLLGSGSGSSVGRVHSDWSGLRWRFHKGRSAATAAVVAGTRVEAVRHVQNV